MYVVNRAAYGWRNGAGFTGLIFIHIWCCCCYSRIYLFTFSGWICIREMCWFTFGDVFRVHECICSHLRDVFIRIRRFIFIHIRDRGVGSARCSVHSAFSARRLHASLGPSSRSIISERNMADEGSLIVWTGGARTQDPKHKCYIGRSFRSPTRVRMGMEHRGSRIEREHPNKARV